MIRRFSIIISLAACAALVAPPLTATQAAEKKASKSAEEKASKEKESKEKESKEKGEMVEGSGFSMFGTEAIKGVDDAKVEKDPVCDRSKRPKINKVEPDEAKPGQKVVIKGENFGTKECLHGVSFSSAAGAKVSFKYVDESTIEATVPEAKAGMSFVIVVAGGGSAQSKPVLIHAK